MDTNTNKDIITAAAAEETLSTERQKSREDLLQDVASNILTAAAAAKEYGKSPYDAIVPQLRELKSTREIEKATEMMKGKIPEADLQEIKHLANQFIWDDPINGLTPNSENYMRDIFYPGMKKKIDQRHYFSTRLFQIYGAGGKPRNVQFAPETLSVIGGRPNAGKTSALVSLAADALRQGKTVTYINCDADNKEVVLKLAMSLLAQKYDRAITDPSLTSEMDPLACLDERLLPGILYDPAYEDRSFSHKAMVMGFYDGDAGIDPQTGEKYNLDDPDKLPVGPYRSIFRMKAALAELECYFKQHKFRIYDTRTANRNWEDFASAIRGLPYGSVAMLDYIQSFEMYPGKEQREFLDQQRKVVSGVTDLASTCGLIFICAAQLKRDTKEESLKLLTQGDFADTSEIEKRANLAIGIGRVLTPEGPRYYYSHVKDRSNPCGGQFWLDERGYKYSYVHAKRAEDNGLIPTPTEKTWNSSGKKAPQSGDETRDYGMECLKEAEEELKQEKAERELKENQTLKAGEDDNLTAD